MNMEKKINLVNQIRLSNGEWQTTFIHSDELEVYKRLAEDLVAKKLHECRYIKRITSRNNYDGTREITVTYGNARTIYTISA